MTLDEAMALASQDCPLPHRAGEALRVMRDHILRLNAGAPGCWCETCRPVTFGDMRMVVCPDCGNKRCPRATNHRNACTASNEPGQSGSSYEDCATAGPVAGRIGRNSGHGHVWPRPDGMKARCGGPGLCAECSHDHSLATERGEL
jgi:hypothetical protein